MARATFDHDDYGRYTSDGLQFVDLQGNPPQLDSDGRLLAPFIVTHWTGKRERWPEGLRFTLVTTKAGRMRRRALQRAMEDAARRNRKLTPAEQAAVYWAPLDPVAGSLPLVDEAEPTESAPLSPSLPAPIPTLAPKAARKNNGDDMPVGTSVHLGRRRGGADLYFVKANTSSKATQLTFDDQAAALGYANQAGWNVVSGVK